MKKEPKNVWQRITNLLYEYQKVSIAIIFTLLLLIFSIVIIPNVQRNIRRSELETLIGQQEMESSKVRFLDLQTADEHIKEEEAITVLFTKPSGDSYEQIQALFMEEKEMEAFHRTVFVYPIIYQADRIKKTYQIQEDAPVFIFFEKGQEKNRLLIDQRTDVKHMLISELNQLPMPKQ